MADNIEGISVANDGEAIKFGIRVDSVHHFCIVSREVLKELSQPGGHKTDLPLYILGVTSPPHQ